MSNIFRYEPFVAVSGNFGGKVPIVDDVLSSHEQKIYPTTSLDENYIKIEFQTDWDYYVDLRETYLALKLKFVNDRGNEIYNTKELKTKSTKKNEKKFKKQGTCKKRRSWRRLQFLSLIM